MARTLTAIDMPAPRAKPIGGLLAGPRPAEMKTQAEEGEPEVIAEPRLMSEALNEDKMALAQGYRRARGFQSVLESARNFTQ